MLAKLIMVLFFSSVSLAHQCPAWIKNKSNLPPCPRDAGLLDDSYPLTGFVISDTLGDTRWLDSEGKPLVGPNPKKGARIEVWPSKHYVWSVLRPMINENKERPPKIYLVGTQETVDFLKSQISSLNIPKEKQKEISDSISLIPVEGQGVWLQDFFEPVTSSSGVVSVRPFRNQYFPLMQEAYIRYAQRIAAAGASCGLKSGDLIGKYVQSDTHGGNIEPGGGGFCLIGSRTFKKNRTDLKKIGGEFCSNPKKIIEVPTNELSVGHADEIVKSIAFENSPRGCKATYLIASPRKALELLGNDSNENLSSQAVKDRSGWGPIESLSNRIHICSFLRSAWIPESKIESPQNKDSIREGSLFFSKAFADSPRTSGSERYSKCMAGQYTNRDIHRSVMGTPLLKDLNSLMQKQYDKLRETITEKVKSEVSTQCKVDFIEVPQLFYPDRFEKMNAYLTAADVLVLREQDGLKDHGIKGLYPNIINSVSAGKLFLSTDPNNESFRRYMKAELEKRGFTTEYIDAINAGGNLHCMTHEIRGCSPR